MDRFVEENKGTVAQDLHVDDISLGVEILTRQCACFVWTFRARLTLSIVYNESFHGRSEIMDFAHTVKNILLEELGVTASI
jgi:hypothetical protein